MKFCETHWTELRTAIADRGLDKLVARDGAQIAKRMSSELENGTSPTNFDPLMEAHNAIVSNAMGSAGLAIMSPNGDGSERCPLCFLVAVCQCPDKGTPACAYAKWIGYAANDSLARAKELGLVGSS